MQATYNGNKFDPQDSKVCEMFGLTFYQGQPVDISGLPADHQKRLSGNPHFTVSGDVQKRRGRPPKQDYTNANDEGDDE